MKTVLLLVTTFLLMSSVGAYAGTIAETGPQEVFELPAQRFAFRRLSNAVKAIHAKHFDERPCKFRITEGDDRIEATSPRSGGAFGVRPDDDRAQKSLNVAQSRFFEAVLSRQMHRDRNILGLPE